MNISEKNNSIILENVRDFDLKQTLDCGQCFRWEETASGWRGAAFGKAVTASQSGSTIVLDGASMEDWENIWAGYFDMGRDYSAIKGELSADAVMREAISFGSGIRILNQEPFECLISFIISASNNIPRIKKIISVLCENFGEPIGESGLYSFPTAEKISSLSLEELDIIRSGFRAKYILNAAKCVSAGMLDLAALKRASYDYAKGELLKLYGVGSKVADCVLLFSLEKYSSFPVDVWIKRIMEHCYFGGSETPIPAVSALAKERFGDLGGFAQQYLFYWARENRIGI